MRYKRTVIALIIFVLLLVCLLVGNSVLHSYISSSNPNPYTNTGKTVPTMGGTYGFGIERSATGLAPQETTSKVAVDSYMPVQQEAAPVAGSNRKIIKSGNVDIVVKDVESTVKQIASQSASLGGYVSSTNLSSSGNKETLIGYVRVRVPVEKVDSFVEYVKNKALHVTSENINSDDVTSEYVDLEARIKNLEASEAQYQEIMKKAVKVEDVLQVQRELTSVRGQIEQLKGQLKYLSGSSELSDITVNVALDEGELPVPPADQWKPGTVFKLALRELVSVAKNLSYFAIYIIVFAVIWIPVGIGLRYFYRYLRRRIK